MAPAAFSPRLVPDPLPVRELRVPSEGAELFVRVVGGARGCEPVIALHGGPAISHEYLEGLEDLAGPERAVVFYDQRGVGRSSGAVDPTRVFAQAVADLEAVRAALGAERAHVLGHSYGGLVAAAHAAHHPDRTASLILIDSIPPTSAVLQAAMVRYRARLTDYQARGLVPVDLPGWQEDAAARLLAILPIYFLDPRHPGARSMNGARFSTAAWLATDPALGDYDLLEAVAQVRAPALSFVSPVPFGTQMGAAMASALGTPGSRAMPLRLGGHFPWLECPDPFFAELRSFLDDLKGTLEGSLHPPR
jgi:pimeloyl-ACP methyl ester carboxylesterase